MTHLSINERLQIETLINVGTKPAQIANQLNRSKSCITREIKRNSIEGKYFHNEAQKLTFTRREKANHSILTQDNWTTVRSFIKQRWSPEQVSGWLKTHPELGFYVSDQWIYNYIYADRAQGGDLYTYLRRAGKPYKKGGKQQYRGKIKDRIDISARPDIINKRLRVGDWEVDSVIGRMNKSSIVTIVERVTRYTSIIKVDSKESEHVCSSIVKNMGATSLPIYSMTGDNGTEFSAHKKISEGLHIDFYFTHPYSSWEKGTNENTNGLIRQYFPKGTEFDTISESMLNQVQTALNNRPRKCLGYKTPAQAMSNWVH